MSDLDPEQNESESCSTAERFSRSAWSPVAWLDYAWLIGAAVVAGLAAWLFRWLDFSGLAFFRFLQGEDTFNGWGHLQHAARLWPGESPYLQFREKTCSRSRMINGMASATVPMAMKMPMAGVDAPSVERVLALQETEERKAGEVEPTKQPRGKAGDHGGADQPCIVQPRHRRPSASREALLPLRHDSDSFLFWIEIGHGWCSGTFVLLLRRHFCRVV